MIEKTSPEDDLFEEALLKTAGPERAAFLEAACRNDHELRARVERMIDGHLHADGFLPTLPERTPPPEGTAAESTGLEQVGSHIGPYKLLQKIGEGGCGVVYVAEQEKPVRRRVALKVIKLGMDTRSVLARFEAERQALAMMDHPNIARVLDAGATDAGRPYFVVELVKGIRITDYCDQNNLTTDERLDLFTQVCHAIQHAHQKGVIHRDIKPSNVLVTSYDGVPVPKVIDFGIAKATQGPLTDLTIYTELNQFIGTPAYMSPEQAEMSGLDIDTRTDIYALGVLLYELLTGTTPFDGQELLAAGLDAMRRTIREKEPVRPSTRLSTMLDADSTILAKHRQTDSSKLTGLLRGDLDWIVMKCLEKDRTRRYETANGLAADLKRHLNHEPVVARPASVAYRFQKGFRRNKLVFSAATAVAVALLAGIGVSTWQAFAAWKAQGETEVARTDEQQQRLEAESQARKASESERQSRRLLYASDMNLAQQSLKLNNLGKARRLLEQHRPKDGGEDLRGWEWRYLWQLTRSSALLTLTNRPARGFSVSFSPDGSRLAVGWLDGQVDLWDVPGRRLVRTLTDRRMVRDLTERVYPHQGRVAFSPVRSLLAATSETTMVTLYDLDSGMESILWRAPDQSAWTVRDIAFSQDGSRLVIYAGISGQQAASSREDAVWVMNVSSSECESHHPTAYSQDDHFGAAQLSPDNRRLYLARSDYLKNRYSIQCIDLTTGQELWQTKPQRDLGLSTLAVSPDGRVLASGSGYEDPAIRVWETATGRLLRQLDGHTNWVCKLVFTGDGRRLISAAGDQSIRFWDTNDMDTGNWTEMRVLRGHTDEVHAVAIAEPAQLVASASKDGDLMLWNADGMSVADGYSRLPENLAWNEVHPLDDARLLLLSPGKPPELVDLKRDAPPVSLPEIGSSPDILGCFGTNILCQWNGTNQILVRELRGAEFISRGAITLDSGLRPTGLTYNATRQLLAWTEEASPTWIHLASLATTGRRIKLESDVPGLVPGLFSEDGKYLVAWKGGPNLLRAWNIETGQVVASINQGLRYPAFAAGGRVLVLAIGQGNDHEIVFHDLVRPDRTPWRVPGKEPVWSLAVSPEGGLVAAPTAGGQVRLFDSAEGELVEPPLHGHLNAAIAVAFSADGRRLISTSGGREAVKVWDLDTRQELLTLSGTGSSLGTARWSADGDVILAGKPWQAWRAPSWEEIAAAEKATEAKSQ